MTHDNKPEAFTSYAQNFEDVVLWRALKHVPQGLYVDIGAEHPVLASVSKAFYERGWRGIHVEPAPYYATMLQQDRPGEQILQVALSDHEGTLDLHVIENLEITTAGRVLADPHQEALRLTHTTIQAPMLTMKTALASLAGQEVHWLKINVDGREEQVLRGWDSQFLRPWIIVIRTTVSMQTKLHYEGINRLLLDANYEFVSFDGVNRFYVASERSELTPRLQTPPNVFDGVELSGLSGARYAGPVELVRSEMQATVDQLSALHVQSEAKATHAEMRATEAAAQVAQADARTNQAEARAKLAEERAVQLEHRATQAEEHIHATEHAPIRRLMSAIRNGRVLSGIKRRSKSVLQVAATEIRRHPLLNRGARLILGCAPPLRRRLGAALHSTRIATDLSIFDDLSPDAAIVARQLQQSQRGLEAI
ncbi:FkbM family methyltransferase [Variovorax sp. EL159]|uniref:FkbM family methyltransferase n=1 Tax=Variovorax sp. EL159 TaxID=1566270 RepID=UPI000889DDBE|nr:FkbM family methyltransferase [Variovorax sp. EL159]SCX72734.1 methyltransferase, FkbM family [Variovorax sp. EL159]